ncbi:MAG: hypothetical protein HYV48_02815 [Candidatus Omnitrophica bacterium]|nr:hypothetical protein [Candidatus Omnitrophota bacterium]
MILTAGIKEGFYLGAILFLLFVGIIFAAIIYHFSRVVFGNKPQAIMVTHGQITAKLSLILLLILILIFGISIPVFLNKFIMNAVEIIKG